MVEQKKPTLRNDFIWTFVGNGLYSVCQWAILVVLAKQGSLEVVGGYSFAVAIATPIITFATFQLRSVQVSDVREQFQFADYFGFRLWTIAAALLSIGGICFALRYPASKAGLIEAVGLALAIEAISDILYGQMQLRRRMDRIAKSMITRGVLSIGMLLSFMAATRNLLAAILAMVAVRMIVTVLYDLRVVRLEERKASTLVSSPVKPRFYWGVQGKMLQMAFPVGLVSLLVALNTSIPRYFIEWHLGPRELGMFSALTFFQSSGNMVVGALGQAAFGRLATSFANRDVGAFSRLISQLLLIGLALGVGGVLVSWLFGKKIIEVLFRPEYATQSQLLTYLMLAASMGFLCQLVGYGVTAARIFKPQIPLFILVASTLAACSYFFVPRTGVAGAITAIFAAGVVQLIGSLLLLWFSLRQQSFSGTWRSGSEELLLGS